MSGKGKASAEPSRLRLFDPVRLADLEYRAWVGYYLRQWPRVLIASVGLVRVGFGLDWHRTLHGAWLVLRANQLWAPYPDNDPDGCRRTMRRFYELVCSHHGETFDPTTAARLEVEWWRVHREHQHQEDGSSDDSALVDALADLYAYVYSVEVAAVRTAGKQRAEAMRYSDQWVREGCHMESPLIEQERAALVRSYAALLAAVHRPPVAM
jgi:hypothetical protein